MSTNVTNQISFLRTSRNFTKNIDNLTQELSKTYLDIANAVNSRTIGMFSTNVPSITGENWFISKNQRQQSLRQIYPFTTTASIPHNIKTDQVERFVRGFGSFTDGTNWYGVIFGSNVAIAGQLSFYITPTVGAVSGQIVFLSGAGAPAVTKGIVVLEWLSQV